MKTWASSCRSTTARRGTASIAGSAGSHGWGAGEPLVVGPGPGNPMGPRALYITAPGLIRIHGTSDPASIGRYASHGCIRMQNADVTTLYPMVAVGTHVVVVGYRPASAGYWDPPTNQDA